MGRLGKLQSPQRRTGPRRRTEEAHGHVLYERVTGKAGKSQSNSRVLERRSAPTLKLARLSRSLRTAGRLYPPAIHRPHLSSHTGGRRSVQVWPCRRHKYHGRAYCRDGYRIHLRGGPMRLLYAVFSRKPFHLTSRASFPHGRCL
jgi:hypothetical protein